MSGKQRSTGSLDLKAMWLSLGERITGTKIMPQTNIKREAICRLHAKFLTMLIQSLTQRHQRRFLCWLQIDFQGNHFPRCGKHSLMRRSLHKCTNCVQSRSYHKVANVKRIHLSTPLSAVATVCILLPLLFYLLLSGVGMGRLRRVHFDSSAFSPFQAFAQSGRTFSLDASHIWTVETMKKAHNEHQRYGRSLMSVWNFLL